MGKMPGIAWAGLFLTGLALCGCESCGWGQKPTADARSPGATPRVATNTQAPNTGWNSQPRAWTTSTVDPATRTANPYGQPSAQVGSTFGAQPTSGYSNTTSTNSTTVPSSNSTSVVPASSLTTNSTRTTDDGYSRQTPTPVPSFDSGRTQGSYMPMTGGTQQPSSLTSPSTTNNLPAPSGIPSSSSSWPPSSSTGTSGSSSGMRAPSFGSSSFGDSNYSRSSSSSTATPVPTVTPGQSDQ